MFRKSREKSMNLEKAKSQREVNDHVRKIKAREWEAVRQRGRYTLGGLEDLSGP